MDLLRVIIYSLVGVFMFLYNKQKHCSIKHMGELLMNFKKQITVLCSALALAVIPLSQAQAKTYRIVYAGFYGPTHPSTLAMEKFKEVLFV